ncbi:CARDB domain-containing protein [Nanoarchaeota archaeon]
MNKLLVSLLAIVLLVGCITIEKDAGNITIEEEVNISLDLDEEPQENSEKPDLMMTNIYWSTLFPKLNEYDDLTVKVMNRGDSSVSGFEYKITLFNEGEEWSEQIYTYEDALGPNNSTKITKGFSFNSSGKYSAEVYLDWDNSIKELDEINNYRQTGSITVSEIEADDGGSDDTDDSQDTTEDVNVTLGEEKCVDTDDGLNYYEKGRCVDDGPFILGMDDYCKDNFHLVELYCTNRTLRCRFAEPYECYCKKGACV